MEFEAEAMEDMAFYEYYVAGADGFLSEAYDRDLYLVNAVRIKYHSIKFDEPFETSVHEMIHHAKPGDVITVPFHPVAINVEVLIPEEVPANIIGSLKDFSLDKLVSQRTFL